jgi:hypothetical protein
MAAAPKWLFIVASLLLLNNAVAQVVNAVTSPHCAMRTPSVRQAHRDFGSGRLHARRVRRTARIPSRTSAAASLDRRSSDPSVCPIRLSIRAVGTPHDANRFRVTVTNVGAVPVGWDRQFVAFLKWRFTDDAGEPLPTTEPSDQHEPQPNHRERFVTLMPGTSLSKEFDLAKPLATFVSGHGSFDVGDIPTGYEELVRFILPDRPTRVKVEVAYAPQGDDLGGFHVWFGFDARDVRLGLDECKSSNATIMVVAK